MKAARLLKYARKRSGLTQRELSVVANMSQPAIARIESGGATPRLDTLERLLNACGFSLEIQIRAGSGVDRTQLRQALKKTPEERARASVAAANNVKPLIGALHS